MRAAIGSMMVVAMVMTAGGCSTAPKSQAEKRGLVAEADATVQTMTARDASLRDMIDRSAGYAVYPNVGAAGAIVGGAYGRGVVFENGRPAGFTELNQGSVGAIIGGQTYAQMIVFENDAALNRLKAGNFDIGAEASAVALKAGVAATTRFEGGIAIFQMPKGGLMATAAVTGQKINFQPMQQSFNRGGSSSEATTAGSRNRSGSTSSASGSSSGGSANTNNRNQSVGTDTRGSAPDEASAYQVDQNLQPDEKIRLRTGEQAQEAAEEAVQEQQQ